MKDQKLSECERVDRELRTIARARSVMDVAEARAIREALRLKIWIELGYSTILNYMEMVLGYAPRAAQDRIRVAKALESLPATQAALESGATSFSAVKEITRVSTPTTERQWLDAVVGLNVRDVERLVRGHAPGDTPDDPKDPTLMREVVHMELLPEVFAQFRQTRIVLEEECGHALDDDQLVAAICTRALEPPEPDRALHQIAVTICEECGRGWQDGAGIAVEIGPEAIELAECDAERIGSLKSDVPERAAQDISHNVRRLVWRRAHGRCQVLGCRSARGLHIHHIEGRGHPGAHHPSNLMLCCSAHHTENHRGELVISGRAPNALVFEWPKGRSDISAEEIAERLTPIEEKKGEELEQAKIIETVLSGLMNCGFRKREAESFIAKARAHVGAASVPELFREALRYSRSL